MMKIILLFCTATCLFSCKPKTDPQDPEKAKQFYAGGMHILDERTAIQDKDSSAASALNQKAIAKFSEAYQSDTTFADATLFASECTMYQKDYKDCLYWTEKLLSIDTSKRNDPSWDERINYCKTQLKYLHIH